ncbi:MAG: hypothetical protein OH318_02925 [Candidatus Parvarchaeota archaeon]|nr:hypothetical protein [Candidatus Rehaiarchaeum fermentans]MCW1293612.1 hypothetical protein [Candidatus Rehaiarchaeum fermentans]
MRVNNFDIAKTLGSGQTFVWMNLDDLWIRFADPFLVLQVVNNEIKIIKGKEKDVIETLGLNDNIELINHEINKDEFISKAIEFGKGIRVVKDGIWVSTLSFLLSIQSNIPLIKSRVLKLAIKFGKKISFLNNEIFLIPNPYQINILKISKKDFGFRYKFIKSAVLEFRKRHPQINNIKGVGDKVRECILLYGDHQLQRFPIDIWIKRAIKIFYPKMYDNNVIKMRERMTKYFGDYAGYAQLYLYNYIRNL